MLYITNKTRSVKKAAVTDKQLGKVTDVASNEKAQQSPAYANAIKKSNLQKISDTVSFFHEYGFTIDELPSLHSSTAVTILGNREIPEAAQNQNKT